MLVPLATRALWREEDAGDEGGQLSAAALRHAQIALPHNGILLGEELRALEATALQ